MGTMAYPSAEQMFWMQYETVRRDEVVGVLLAIFLGCFGIHHFYVGRNGLGILYCCLFWTGIPAILGLIECFFMPGRVRSYNAVQAAGIAGTLGIAIPGYLAYPGWVAPGFTGAPYGSGAVNGSGGSGYAQPNMEGYAPVYRAGQEAGQAVVVAGGETTLVVCEKCRMTNPLGSRFCSGCGTGLV